MGQGKIALWVAVIGVLGIVAAALIASGFGSDQHGGPRSRITQNGKKNVACRDQSGCIKS